MGYKSVCIDCRKSLNVSSNFTSNREYPCSQCGKPMKILSYSFRPPRKADDKKWETVKFLVENGFLYYHIYKVVDVQSGARTYAKYPENIKDAIEFVEKYKDQIST